VREAVATLSAPQAIGPYSQGIKVGNLVFISGQVGTDPETGALETGGIEIQTRRALKNLEAVVTGAGLELKDVVKVNVYLTDMGDFAAMNAVYREFFESPFPARCCVHVGDLAGDADVEIDAMAVGNPQPK
jgi:2-iminobutanoate/2-iminopropanoate deaminase